MQTLDRHRARQLGVVKRQRKVAAVALVAALVLGFDGAQRRTIAGFRRCGTERPSVEWSM